MAAQDRKDGTGEVEGAPPQVQVHDATQSEKTVVAGRATMLNAESLFGVAFGKMTSLKAAAARKYGAKVSEAEDAKQQAKALKILLFMGLAFFAIVLGVVMAGNELSKEVKYDGTTTEMRTKSDDLLVETGSVKSYSTLADLPKQGLRFLETLDKITFVDPDAAAGVTTSRITSHVWFNTTSMVIQLATGSDKIEIGGGKANLFRNGKRVLITPLGGWSARRRLLASVGVTGDKVRAFTRAELHTAVRKLHAEENSGSERRRLAQTHPLFSMYVAFGAIIEASASATDVNKDSEQYSAIDSSNTPASITLAPLTKWTLQLQQGATTVNEKWYLDYNLGTGEMRFKIESHVSDSSLIVQEMHSGSIFTYSILDQSQLTAQLANEPALNCTGLTTSLTLNGTTCADLEDVLQSENLAFAAEAAVNKVSCTVKTAPDTKSTGDTSGAPLVQTIYDNQGVIESAVWTVGGFHIRADASTGTPTAIVNPDDVTSVFAVVQSVEVLTTADGLFEGCDPARRLNSDDTGIARRRLTFTPQMWAAYTWMVDYNAFLNPGANWCGAGNDLISPPCPNSGSTTYNRERICRRHDHAKKSVSAGSVTRTSCDVDSDLETANNAFGEPWSFKMFYAKWGAAGTWGCYDRGSYYCWQWFGWWYGWQYGPFCSAEFVRYGPTRYDTIWHTYGYTRKHKQCSGDLTGQGYN